MKAKPLIAVAVLVGLPVAPAKAEILGYGTYLPDFIFESFDKLPVFVPLSGKTADLRLKKINFTVPKTGKVKITFNAECFIQTVQAPGNLVWVDIDLVIDGKAAAPVPPTAGGLDAFCGTRVEDVGQAGTALSRPSISVVTTLTAGKHDVSVLAKFGAPVGQSVSGTTGGLSQSTTIIEQ